MSINEKFKSNFLECARSIYKEDFIPLHRPVFEGNEKKYLNECIDSNFVSSAGKKVTEFEDQIAAYTGSNYAIATVNGTSALHIALKMAGVLADEEVITQALTFVATCNALNYIGASPIFIDVDLDTLGMSPKALRLFLEENVTLKEGIARNKISGKKVSACVPMHTYGFPCKIDEIRDICNAWSIPLVEDAAESLGSFYKSKHTGTFGDIGILSFNGNKLITTGGGGMIITNDEKIAINAKHITTTSKIAHPYKFFHNEVGYNYRMPNLNAALGCAQMEQLESFLKTKRNVTKIWKNFFKDYSIDFITQIDGANANNWLNVIILENIEDRDLFLEFTNNNNVMTRPAWELMSELPAFKNSQKDNLTNTYWLAERIINIPSSVP